MMPSHTLCSRLKLLSMGDGKHSSKSEAYHSLIGHGYDPVLREFDEEGNDIWTLQFGILGSQNSYRAFKSPWVGQPKTKPKAKACVAHGGAKVYVSWNGATEVAAWKVYAGEKEGRMRVVKTVQKAGFETMVRVGGEVKYVKIEAVMKGHGRHAKAGAMSEVVQLEDC